MERNQLGMVYFCCTQVWFNFNESWYHLCRLTCVSYNLRQNFKELLKNLVPNVPAGSTEDGDADGPVAWWEWWRGPWSGGGGVIISHASSTGESWDRAGDDVIHERKYQQHELNEILHVQVKLHQHKVRTPMYSSITPAYSKRASCVHVMFLDSSTLLLKIVLLHLLLVYVHFVYNLK